ncbi:MAG: Ig-like domain-containing protein [Sphingobacteriaceae bacterium]|nr:Ig-like domain-containing protein [Sphingobacteriaceae bacterium]
MRKTKNFTYFILSLICFTAISQIWGCASIQHPTGGPRDSVAPIILNESPKNFTTNFKGDKINIEFDEFFKLTNEFKEISVSPAMEKNPIFKTKKKTLNISFQEPLQDSTTYTINFGKAIADYNEGIALKNYMYVLSTGSKIDSLSISGTVLNTLTKEPVLDATVFLLPLNQDTLFGKKRASLFTSTDSSGNYSLKYLKAGTYNIYALKEEGGDKIYNSTNELIGFLNQPIVLSKDTADIGLEIFKELPKNFRVTDRKIEKDGRITFVFNRQLSNPELKIVTPAELDNNKITEFSAMKDSAYLWTQSMDFDSISIAIHDDKISLDTVLIRRSKRDTYNKALTITDNVSSSRLKPGSDVALILSAPVKSIDGKKFALLQDSIPVAGLRVSRDSASTRKIYLKYPWKDERKYIVNIGEGGFTGTFGGTIKDYTAQFTKDVPENYGEMSLVVTVPDTSKSYLIQVLSEQDKIITQSSVSRSRTLSYPLLSIGRYYIRAIYDENRNGKWDTGNVKEKIQPEEVWNYDKEISLRANFEIEEPIVIPKLK